MKPTKPAPAKARETPRKRTSRAAAESRPSSTPALKPLQVGLLGIGTVGLGTWTVLQRNAEEISRRAGRPIRITWIAEKALDRARELTRGAAGVNLTADARGVLAHPDIDIVIELIGGIEPARTFILEAISNGKHVVTANKAL